MCNELKNEYGVPEYMKIKPISAWSGIPEKYIRQMIKNGEVEYFRPGRKSFYVSTKSLMSVCSGCNQR